MVDDTNQLCPQCQTSLVLLRNRYRPMYSCGGSGFRKIYWAIDHDRFGIFCYIKQLIPRDFNTPATQKAKELLEQEARQLQSGKNFQIPSLSAYFTEGNYFYLIRNYISFEDYLRDFRREGIVSKATVIRLLTVRYVIAFVCLLLCISISAGGGFSISWLFHVFGMWDWLGDGRATVWKIFVMFIFFGFLGMLWWRFLAQLHSDVHFYLTLFLQRRIPQLFLIIKPK